MDMIGKAPNQALQPTLDRRGPLLPQRDLAVKRG